MKKQTAGRDKLGKLAPKSHLIMGKEHGLTHDEVVETVTQLAFYCGWPKAWSTFPLIEEVYGDD